jgi:16S rRNA (guanine527-N7)-methyltransferase
MTQYTQDNIKQVFALSDEAFEGLEIYHKVLIKWQKAINLVSGNTLGEAWHRHFADSAQMAAYIPSGTKIYADLGCGAGFPGLVIAMMRPELDVHLVESDERKGQFMRTVVRETATKNVTIHTKRVEDVTGGFIPDFISARALASLDRLFGYCLPWAQANKELALCFMKGERVEEEIKEAQIFYDFIYKTSISTTDPKARIIVVRGLIRK